MISTNSGGVGWRYALQSLAAKNLSKNRNRSWFSAQCNVSYDNTGCLHKSQDELKAKAYSKTKKTTEKPKSQQSLNGSPVEQQKLSARSCARVESKIKSIESKC